MLAPAPQEKGPSIRTGGGRGVIIPASDRTQLAGAYVSVSVLRSGLGCRLPIHIVHNGPGALPKSARELFQASTWPQHAAASPKPPPNADLTVAIIVGLGACAVVEQVDVVEARFFEARTAPCAGDAAGPRTL